MTEIDLVSPRISTPSAGDGVALALFIQAQVQGTDLKRLLPRSVRTDDLDLVQLIASVGGEDLGSLTSRFMSSLDDRERLLTCDRVLSRSPRRQSDLAREQQVSRQRMSQLEQRVLEKLSEFLTSTRSAVLYADALGEWAAPVESWTSLTNNGAVRAGIEAAGEPVLGIARQLLRYRLDGAWLISPSIEGRWASLMTTLRGAADDDSYLDAQIAESLTEDLFRSEVERAQRLTELGMVRVDAGWLVENTGRARIVACLKESDEPLAVEEISERCGVSGGYTMNVLSGHPEIARADKDRWGLASRIDDVYDGIVGEIEQRIDEHGGAVALKSLLRDLPARFNVAEASVRAYAMTPVFTIDAEGMVRRRDQYTFRASPPDSVSGAIALQGTWYQPVILRSEHFRGYSIALSPHIAYANGVRPGDSVVVPIAGCDQRASVIWRKTSVNGLVEVGRTRAELQRRGLRAGDRVFIAPRRESVELLTAAELADRRSVEAPARLGSGGPADTETSDDDPILNMLRRRSP